MRSNSMFLSEDNIRIIILTFVLLSYMIFGAMIFQLFENDSKIETKTNLSYFLNDLKLNYNCTISYQKFHQRLYEFLHWNGFTQLKLSDRYKWDFPGSFHFVGSIVTTIGYGNITPKTRIGKGLVIIFGFFGCAGGILFFNLFLERIITFIAFVLRHFHYRRKKQSQGRKISNISSITKQKHTVTGDDDNGSNSDRDFNDWKPSVYLVLFTLIIASTLILCLSATLYSLMENWSFFDALYFSFVSFTTIGFGDYVITQNHTSTFRIGNFVFIILGCCCTYSLLNVTSIVIKQFLNCFISKIKNRYCDRSNGIDVEAGGPIVKSFWRKKSSATQNRRHRKLFRRHAVVHISNDNNESSSRKSSRSSLNSSLSHQSSEMISMKDFLKSNKISLAVMQKQLYETAQGHRLNSHKNYKFFHTHNFIPALVGSLAIVSEKLNDKSYP